MTVQLPPDVEQAIADQAKRQGTTPEALAVDALRQKFAPLVPQDEWEARILGIGVDCGVSPPDEALTSEGLYD
jgi:hypothetical protein